MSKKVAGLLLLALGLVGCAPKEAAPEEGTPAVEGSSSAISVKPNLAQGPAGGEVYDQNRPVGTAAHSDSIGEAAIVFPPNAQPEPATPAPAGDQG